MTLTSYRDARPIGRVSTQNLEQPATGRLRLPVRLYLLATILPILFNLGALTLSAQRMLLMVLVLPLTFNLVRGTYGRLLWTDIFFFLHVVWVTVSVAVNNPDRVIQNAGSTGVEFLGGYLIGRAYIRSASDLVALARFLVFLVCCMLPFALFESLTGRPILIELLDKLPGLNSVEIVDIEARMGLERVQAVFAHPIHFGLFCCSIFSFAFVGLNGIMPTAPRHMATAAIGLCVFLSLSSGALLPLFLQILLIFWAYMFGRVHYRWLVLLGLFFLIYITIALLSNRPPIRVFMSYATFSAHNAYWRSIIFDWGMINVWGSPIFGIGLNDWVRPFYMYSGSMDNFWLVMAVRSGIPGFSLLALGYFPALWWIARRKFDGNHHLWLLRRAWMFTFAALTLTLCTVHIWTFIYSFVLFLFGAGMWFLTIETPSGPQKATMPDENTEENPSQPFSLNRSKQADVKHATSNINRDLKSGTSYSRFTVQEDKSKENTRNS